MAAYELNLGTDACCSVDDRIRTFHKSKEKRREYLRSACEGPARYTYEDKKYCVLHCPDKGEEDLVEFQKALERKIQDSNSTREFNFRGVWFPNKFGGFKEFEFCHKADFCYATFAGFASFTTATFRADAYFNWTRFEDWVSFEGVTFEGKTFFEHPRFRGNVIFRSANFLNTTKFKGSEEAKDARTAEEFTGGSGESVANAGARVFTPWSLVQFRYARVEDPSNLLFEDVVLRPGWYIGMPRTRELIFSNVYWRGISDRLFPRSVSDEIDLVKRWRWAHNPHYLLETACRELAINAEENHRYIEASRLRYWATDARRRESWWGWHP